MTKPREQNAVEPPRSEDDIQRDQLGPRGVPGAPDPARVTPQRDKKSRSILIPATRLEVGWRAGSPAP